MHFTDAHGTLRFAKWQMHITLTLYQIHECQNVNMSPVWHNLAHSYSIRRVIFVDAAVSIKRSMDHDWHTFSVANLAFEKYWKLGVC